MPVRRGFRLHRDSHFIRWISAARGESASSAIDIGNPPGLVPGFSLLPGAPKQKSPARGALRPFRDCAGAVRKNAPAC